MSLGDLTRYAFINAKLRSRIGSMLSDEHITDLINSHSLEELFQKCKGTVFEPLSNLYNETGDIQHLEAWLFERHVHLHQEVAKFMKGFYVEVVEAFNRKLEVENLKGVLRLWFSNKVKQENIDYRYGYLYHNTIVSYIDWAQIVNADTFEEIKKALKESPYESVVGSVEDDTLSAEGMFFLETALDRHWIELLRKRVERMRAKERGPILQLLDRDADLKNCINLVRFGSVYDVGKEELEKLMLQGGELVKTKEFATYLEASQQERSVFTLVEPLFPLLAKELQEKRPLSAKGEASLVERYLFSVRKESYRKMLRGYPFSFGVILAYFFLEERQNALIRTIINGIYYGFSPQQIEEYTL